MRIDDGFSTIVSFSLNASVKLWEKEVTPPGIDGGGPNDTTTMRNTSWRTMAPKKLRTLSPASMSCAYDPAVFDQIVAMVNMNQAITLTFADGSQLVFWGWLNSFTPAAAVEGEQPTAEVSVQPSNQDADGNEIAPVFTAAETGT